MCLFVEECQVLLGIENASVHGVLETDVWSIFLARGVPEDLEFYMFRDPREEIPSLHHSVIVA